jgi:hypothetical protein
MARPVKIDSLVVQRKVLAPNGFHTPDELETGLLKFQDYLRSCQTRRSHR